MADLAYREVYAMDRVEARKRLVQTYRETGSISQTARLLQVDVKDILDKGALGPSLWDHLRKGCLPRYQWTACESRSRLRFLAYSHTRTLANGLTFLSLVLCWLRLHLRPHFGHGMGGNLP